jgi:adenine-specific DNA-methyltransferase
MTAFDIAHQTVSELVYRFERGIKHYTSPQYQESEVRQDFIDDFFTALGWDVRHREQQNPYEQEVKIEKSQKQQEAKAQKRADYAFYLVPNFKDEKFFAEAKKPSVGLKNPDHYFQTIRYGWSANVPVSILTDFEEFHIIDCRIKPDVRYVFNGQHKVYRYTDYLEKDKFAEIYWIFSREAVANGSLEKYSASLPKSKGKAIQKTLFRGGYKPIDEDFLEYIDAIREDLAKAFKKNDENLNGEELTEAIQRTIDRLVFVRFLEDKLIEPENHVSEWTGWKDFVSDCRKLDAKYNGIVFKKHFIDSHDFAGAEEKLFRDICSDISNLNSPYQFNYLPIHILGSIYERFLGKIVIATAKRVHIEPKPEVRKAGGVYYTPKYIVDYIVSNTVGKLIDGKPPKEIAHMRFADIACGSGSFLIGVYDLLLEYHRKYYNEKLSGKTDIDKRSEDFNNTEYKDGQWILTLKLKQDILLNNIYGLDIDAQAVEVTQLSLFLKMLEDESLSSTQIRQVTVFSKVLPDLSKNIICGNSLIGSDILNVQLFQFEEEKKLNPRDFEITFPKIMESGGFDAIIGNPPYVLLEGEFRDQTQLNYYKNNYYSASYKIDLYHLFIERALRKLKKGGKLGYITPSNFLTNNGLKNLRHYILQNSSIAILNVINGKVFKGASVDTAVTILTKGITTSVSTIVNSNGDYKSFLESLERTFSQDIFLNTEGYLFTSINKKKEYSNAISLGDLAFVKFGMQLRDRKKFTSDVISNSEKTKITKYHRECYTGRDVERYYTNYSNLLAYFNRVAKRGGCWDEDIHNAKPKILVRQIGLYPICCMDEIGRACLNTLFMVVNKKETIFSPYYILGILNSKFIQWYWKENYYDQRTTFPKIKGSYLEELPIRNLDFSKKTEKEEHDNLVKLVQQILQTKIQFSSAKTERDKTFLESKFATLENQIDKSVYQLYELTPDEIHIIEKG